MSTVWIEKDFGGSCLVGGGTWRNRAVAGFRKAKSERESTERKLREVCLAGECGLFEVCLGVYIGGLVCVSMYTTGFTRTVIESAAVCLCAYIGVRRCAWRFASDASGRRRRSKSRVDTLKSRTRLERVVSAVGSGGSRIERGPSLCGFDDRLVDRIAGLPIHTFVFAEKRHSGNPIPYIRRSESLSIRYLLALTE